MSDDPPRRPPELDDPPSFDGPLEIDFAARLERVRERRAGGPVLAPATPSIADTLPAELPREGLALDDVLEEVERVAVAHARRNDHPGFFGYVCSPGLPTDPLAHALVAELNQNVTGFPSAPGATAIERALVRWLARLAGLPAGAGGLLVSGGSMANFTALATALRRCAGPAFRTEGLAACGGPFTVYVSDDAHFSVERAALVLGLGTARVRRIPSDAGRRMRPEALAATLDADRAAGAVPVCVAAAAGTTIAGAIDPLDAIGEICRRRGIWLHVDAAYGGGFLLSEALRARFAGIGKADSVALDLHKAFGLAFDGSALLFREPDEARAAFRADAGYISMPARPDDAAFGFIDLGLETSRRFRALPAWIALRHYGAERLGRIARRQVLAAEYLAALVEAHPDLELAAPPGLSICCFRWAPPPLRGQPHAVDAANRLIRERLAADGDYYLSPTELDGRPVLRVCILSHATRGEHVEELVRRVAGIGGTALPPR